MVTEQQYMIGHLIRSNSSPWGELTSEFEFTNMDIYSNASLSGNGILGIIVYMNMVVE